MTSKVAAFGILLKALNLATIFASFKFYEHGDVIIGQLLPVYQTSGEVKCASPDLAGIMKVEALFYAADQLTSDGLRIGYDVIDTCSETKPRAKINLAVKRWFKNAKNISRVPIAVITELSDANDFSSLRRERLNEGKHIPLISLKCRKNLRDNAYSMCPEENTPQRAIFGLIRHFNWNILDIVKSGDVDDFEYFKQLTRDSDVCLLNEISFKNDLFTWSQREQRTSPVAVVFAKGHISAIIKKLPNYNLSDWNIILGHEIMSEKLSLASNMEGLVGIRRNYGNLTGFKQYLKTSQSFKKAVSKKCCSQMTAAQCATYEDDVIFQNIHLGAPVIDAVYAVIKSLETHTNKLPNLTENSVTSATGQVVSFDPKNLNRNQVMYDVLNIHRNKLLKVGQVQFGPNMKVTVNESIFWKSKKPREIGRCSKDCEPGTWRDVWNSAHAKKCCWDCRTCDLGTVSSYTNSSRCVKCPVGTKPTSNQSKCQPPYVDYLKWYDPFSLIMIFLLAFTICFLVYAVNIFVKKANTPVFLRSKSASLPFLLSLFVTFVLPVLLLMKPTQNACGAYNAIFMFSLGIPLTFLVARSHVILNYCYGNDGELKRKWLHCSPQTVISFILIVLQLTVVVIVLGLSPPQVLTLATREPNMEYIECASHSRPDFLPLVFCILVLILAFNMLHMNEESSPLNQNEVKFVSLGIYLMYSLIFVYFVAVFGINGKKKIRLLCAIAYLFGLNFFATVFLPKIYVILFKPEENLPDVTHLLNDENGNQDVSRLTNKDCVGSPLLGLLEGPYDRTEV